MILLVFIGSFLILNGLFHISMSLLDEKPILAGLRYLNWISLFLGALILYFGLKRVLR
jgi:uncharacterized membrane protein HdeD (DUF308 family)